MKKIIASILISLTLSSAVHAEAVRKPESSGSTTSTNNDFEDFINKKKYKPNVGRYEKGKGVKVTKSSKDFEALIHKLPTAGKIALKLAKGYNNAAIALALFEILGKSVDWVLDPQNNAVKYREDAEFSCRGENGSTSLFEVANKKCLSKYASNYKSHKIARQDSNEVLVEVQCDKSEMSLNPTLQIYCDPARDFEQTKTLEEIADKLKEMAENGNKTAQQAIEDTVAEMAKGGELDPELEQAAKPRNPKDPAKDKDPAKEKDPTKDKDPAKEKDPEAEPKPFELPAFCEWTGICPAWLNTEKNTEETAENTNKIEKNTKEIDKTTKKQLEEETSFFKDVRDFFKWFKKEPDFKKDPDLKDFDTPEKSTDLQDPSRFDKNYVSVNAQCPADVVKEIPLPGRSFRLVFEMTPICDFASIYLRPVIIFIAYIYGALSIGNAFKVGG